MKKKILKIISVIAVVTLIVVCTVLPCFANPIGGTGYSLPGLDCISLVHSGGGGGEPDSSISFPYSSTDDDLLSASIAVDSPYEPFGWSSWQLNALSTEVLVDNPAYQYNMYLNLNQGATSLTSVSAYYDSAVITSGDPSIFFARTYNVSGVRDYEYNTRFVSNYILYLPRLVTSGDVSSLRYSRFVITCDSVIEDIELVNTISLSDHSFTSVSWYNSNTGTAGIEQFPDGIISEDIFGYFFDLYTDSTSSSYPCYITDCRDTFESNAQNGLSVYSFGVSGEYYDGDFLAIDGDVNPSYPQVNPLQFVFDTIGGVLDTEIFNQIKIGHLVLAVLALPLFKILINLFAGG